MSKESGPKNELILLVETSGLEKTKQNQIAETLGIFFSKASEWNDTIKSIVITQPGEIGKMKMAREGRLALKNMRLDSQKVVKAKRDEVKYAMANFTLEDKLWLKAGQMIEATFNNLETQLEEKETFDERWELKRKEAIRDERIKILTELSLDPLVYDLLNMSVDQFAGIVEGQKVMIENQKRIEAERIAKEKAEAEERERIRLENEKLRKEAEEREKAIQKERAKAEAEHEALEEKNRKEKEIAEVKAKKEREESEKKLIAERQAKAKLESELKAKTEAEVKAKKDAKAKIESECKAKELAEKKAKSAPDKVKLENLAVIIDTIKFPELKDADAKKILADTEKLLDKVSKYIREQIKSL